MLIARSNPFKGGDLCMSSLRLHLLYKFVQHPCAISCRVSAQQVLLRFLQFPIVSVTLRTISSLAMNSLYSFKIVRRKLCTDTWL